MDYARRPGAIKESGAAISGWRAGPPEDTGGMKTLFAVLVAASAAFADGMPFSGQVVDADGNPAPGVTFGAEWNNKSGTLKPLQAWRPGADGKFAGEIHWIKRPMAFLALDAARKNGAVTVVEEKDLHGVLTMNLKLGPVSEVSGELACPALGALGVSTVVINTAPVGARVALLQVSDDKFSLPLPPGNYEVEAFAFDAVDFKQAFTVEPGGKAVNLGKLAMEATTLAKSWGKPAPAFSATAARGIDAKTTIAGLKGKWVLVVFWSGATDQATRVIFPRLATFLDAHKGDRDQFEILALHDPTAKTWDDYEAKVKHVKAGPWAGADPALPILLDASGETWKAWGINKLPVMALVDPDGNVVRKGDDSTLEEKLRKK